MVCSNFQSSPLPAHAHKIGYCNTPMTKSRVSRYIVGYIVCTGKGQQPYKKIVRSTAVIDNLTKDFNAVNCIK